MSWGAKRRRLERLEQRTGIGQPERTYVALMERILDSWGEETPVKKWIPETDEDRDLLQLFAEVDDDPPKYQPTPEEQLAEQFAQQEAAAAAPDQPDSPDVLPLPNGLHELCDGEDADVADGDETEYDDY
jgi:hypothetical protein